MVSAYELRGMLTSYFKNLILLFDSANEQKVFLSYSKDLNLLFDSANDQKKFTIFISNC